MKTQERMMNTCMAGTAESNHSICSAVNKTSNIVIKCLSGHKCSCLFFFFSLKFKLIFFMKILKRHSQW